MMKLQFEESLGLTDTDKVSKVILERNPSVRGLNVAYGDQASLEFPDEFRDRLDLLGVKNFPVVPSVTRFHVRGNFGQILWVKLCRAESQIPDMTEPTWKNCLLEMIFAPRSRQNVLIEELFKYRSQLFNACGVPPRPGLLQIFQLQMSSNVVLPQVPRFQHRCVEPLREDFDNGSLEGADGSCRDRKRGPVHPGVSGWKDGRELF